MVKVFYTEVYKNGNQIAFAPSSDSGLGLRSERGRNQHHRTAFVSCLLPLSQLEFHLFLHWDEMALIVGSDV